MMNQTGRYLSMGLAVSLVAISAVFLGNARPGMAADSKPAASSHQEPNQKTYSGIIASQTTNWGIYTIKACSQGIRITTHTKAVSIATPPDWTVFIFRIGEKRAAKITYDKFRTKNLRAVKLSQIGQKPHLKRVAGIDALEYDFFPNQKLEDTTMGGLYRTRQTPPIVLKKEVVFAPNIDYLPRKLKGIWSNYFEIPIFEEIPMQTILYLNNGEKRAYFDTKTFQKGTMTPEDFRVPPGLVYTAQFAEMIYGKEMEGVADLLYP